MNSVKQKRKSCALARVLSIILPGLGSIYAGEYITGILWMLPGLVILGANWVVIKLIMTSTKAAMITGAPMSYSGRASNAFLIITAGYFIYSVYSSKDASKSAAEFNARQALNEMND
jgi:hypothetical protein